MAVYNNALLAEQQFGVGKIGSLTPGAQADIIFVDYQPFTELTAENLPWQILFGFHESMVTTTLVAGKVLMRDRQLTTLDEEKITAEARKLSAETWKRYHQIALQ
jgi:cytosine/adenosine deaminase-related metal-dependent hydrolase